ncbi:MAG: hypothetical protein ACXADL_13945 [Candidatus Thorarchaeota archaeon]|jgi:hypothetical protein
MANNKLWAISNLKRNRIQVDSKKKIVILGKKGPGIKMWRMIDCLCNYFGFHWVREQDG